MKDGTEGERETVVREGRRREGERRWVREKDTEEQ